MRAADLGSKGFGKGMPLAAKTGRRLGRLRFLLTPLARRGRRLAEACEVASALLKDREDLIHKATGWLLREAGKTGPQRLESFLLPHGSQIPRAALRYAIEKPAPEPRALLLRDTRASADAPAL